MSAVVPWATLAIVVATLVGVAIGRWPWLRADRATITLLGAALVLAVGGLSLDQAFKALDLDTLLLLFSMMVLNGNLYLAGFFRVVTGRVVHIAHTPRVLLALVIIASGVLSALFLNDTVVLMLTPLGLNLTTTLKRNPLPYLIGLATAANVGSAATITGNPQNIIIGSASGIPFATFAGHLAPVSLIGLAICWGVIVLLYRNEFRRERFEMPQLPRGVMLRSLLRKSAVVLPIMIVLFVIGVPVALAAFLAAAAMLATRRLKPDRVFATVDWSLLVFFAALFVVVDSLEVQGFTDVLFQYLAPLARAGLVPFGLATAVLSNLISNVPAVLLLQHLINAFPDQNRAWLMLAAASTLAGNLTLLGSVANLIVAEIALRWNVRLSFGEYLKAGVPITILTLAVALLWV